MCLRFDSGALKSSEGPLDHKEPLTTRGCTATKSYILDTKLIRAAQSFPILKGAEGLSIYYGKTVTRKRQVVKG